MIIRARVRAKPRGKKRSKVTGLVYLFGYRFANQTVLVMDLQSYNAMRKRLIEAYAKLARIKRLAADVRVTEARKKYATNRV